MRPQYHHFLFFGGQGWHVSPACEPSGCELSETRMCLGASGLHAVSEVVPGPPSPAGDPSALPSPTPPPPCSQRRSLLFTQCQPLCARCCAVLQYFARCCAVRLKCFIFLCIILEKCYIPVTVRRYIADCAAWVHGLTSLDLGTNRT